MEDEWSQLNALPIELSYFVKDPNVRVLRNDILVRSCTEKRFIFQPCDEMDTSTVRHLKAKFLRGLRRKVPSKE